MAAALRRPLIRVNQLGYLTRGPKRATLIESGSTGRRFEVIDEHGQSAHAGTSRPHVDDSIFVTHTLDFSEFVSEGTAWRVRCGDLVSVPFRIDDSMYTELAGDALAFFYPQRSGVAIDEERAPGYGRPAGHVGIPPNRGDTKVRRWTGTEADALNPHWTFDHPGLDVTGGWYDAGDHGKYVVCGGLSAALLLSAAQSPWDDGGGPGSTAGLVEEATWELDWMLKMQVPSGHQHAGLAFHRVHDVRWTELPQWPHLDPAERALHRPSTAAGLNLAAVAAMAARSLPTRRRSLIEAAITAYDAALREPDLLAPNDHGRFGGGPYDDDDVTDEFYWAAVELYLTTRLERFSDDLRRSRHHRDDVFRTDGFDWDDVAPFARLQLAVHGDEPSDRDDARAAVVSAAQRLVDVHDRSTWSQPYEPFEPEWDWGSNGRILSNISVLATAAHLSGHRGFADAALRGFDYILGRNPVGMSFVTGYGTHFSHRQRVRHFAHALDERYPPPPRGSLAGGAASKAYPGFPGDDRFDGVPDPLCYVDEPTSETTNDVCIRWNAALVHASALVASLRPLL